MTRNLRIGAVLAALALVAACDSSESPSPAPSSSSSADDGGVIDLVPIAAGVALEPATYAMPYVGDEGTADDPRALVDVPEGYFSAGGWVVDDGHDTVAPDEYGDIVFVAD